MHVSRQEFERRWDEVFPQPSKEPPMRTRNGFDDPDDDDWEDEEEEEDDDEI
jgi:hypothetical protein